MPSYHIVTSSVQDILGRFPNNGLTVPPFQRSNEAWEQIPEMRTQLIQSVLLNIPIPPVWIYGTYTNGSVIDGLQRLTTLHMFRHNEFKLRRAGLAPHLQEAYAGRDFRSLTPEDQNKFNNYLLGYYALGEDCPVSPRDMFAILNRHMPANPAEILSGVLLGDRARTLVGRMDSLMKGYVPVSRWETYRRRSQTLTLVLSALIGLKALYKEYEPGNGEEFGSWGMPMRKGGHNPTETLRRFVASELECLTAAQEEDLLNEFQLACQRLHRVFEGHLLDADGKNRFNLSITILRFAAAASSQQSPDWWEGHRNAIQGLFKSVEDTVKPDRQKLERAFKSVRAGLSSLDAAPMRALN